MRDRSKEKIISIDFDGVLASYKGYKGEDITGEPIPGSRDFVLLLQSKGFTPVIFSTRKSEVIQQWLQDNNFPELEVTSTKYPSWIYIDDRCLKFDGDYEKLMDDMRNFSVYREDRPNRFADLGKE